MQGTVSFSISYQQWVSRQWLLISAPCLCLVSSLIFSHTKQPYSRVGNARMYRYGNAVLFRIFTRNYKIKRGIINFVPQRNFKQTSLQEILLRKSNAYFLWRFEYIQKHPLFNEGKDKTLQDKIIVCKCIVTYEAWYPSTLYAPAHILDDPLHSFSCART